MYIYTKCNIFSKIFICITSESIYWRVWISNIGLLEISGYNYLFNVYLALRRGLCTTHSTKEKGCQEFTTNSPRSLRSRKLRDVYPPPLLLSVTLGPIKGTNIYSRYSFEIKRFTCFPPVELLAIWIYPYRVVNLANSLKDNGESPQIHLLVKLTSSRREKQLLMGIDEHWYDVILL